MKLQSAANQVIKNMMGKVLEWCGLLLITGILTVLQLNALLQQVLHAS